MLLPMDSVCACAGQGVLASHVLCCGRCLPSHHLGLEGLVELGHSEKAPSCTVRHCVFGALSVVLLGLEGKITLVEVVRDEYM